jgi:hypothetical protein
MVRLSIQRVAAGLLVLGLGGAGSAWSAQTDTPVTQTVVLHPTHAAYLRIDFDYNSGKALPPFENEPALLGKKTARGLIPTVPPTPILRNITDNALYVKADHNQDFSIGSSVTYQSRYDGHVLFENLEVATERDSLVIPYTIRMYTYESGCAGWFEVISGWAGPFDLDGEQWTLGIVDNLDGQIDDRDLLSLSTLREMQEALFVRDCPVPQTLFFAGHSFRLAFSFKSMASEVVLEATLTEIRPAMGQLDVKTDGCSHLRLRDDGQIVLLSRPTGTLSLPVGNYRVDNCILQSGSNRHLAPKFVSCARTVSIRSDQTAALSIGAPLSNSVEVSREKNLLRLRHQLTGAGGERYECLDRRNSPSFAIYKGPLRIAGSTFPFG